MQKLLIIILLLGLASSGSEVRRVVSLSPALTELVFHLGCADKLVGRSDACDYPPAAKVLPVAGRFAVPYVEQIISLQPDLLITHDLINPGISKVFTQRGIEVLMLPSATLTDYRQNVLYLGERLQAAGTAAELQRIDEFLSTTPPALGVKILWVIWDSPLMVGGAHSLPDEIIRLCGAANLAGAIPQAYCKCSFEWLWENQPDLIFWSGPPRDLRQDRLWRSLQAVQEGRVICDLPAEILLRPGPRMLEGVRSLRLRLQAYTAEVAPQTSGEKP
ncbi:MAG: ABC transporter substrate-binding protein [Lentisphaerae bacterium]|nr:ABC transporter substrate-binding protein [Lentisphaerota bacterium]